MNAFTAHLCDAASNASAPVSRSKDRSAVAKDFLIRAFDAVAEWQERARERRHLMGMSDRGLRDLGLARTMIDAEATRPFWRR